MKNKTYNDFYYDLSDDLKIYTDPDEIYFCWNEWSENEEDFDDFFEAGLKQMIVQHMCWEAKKRKISHKDCLKIVNRNYKRILKYCKEREKANE